MRPKIQSKKHYVQTTRSTVATVSVANLVIAEAKNVSGVSAVDEVVEGASISAVFCEYWIENSSNGGSFGLTLCKIGQLNSPAYADMVVLGNWDNKKNVLYHTQGLPPNDGVSGAVPIVRQWFKIPKSKQRFGLGDRLMITVSNFGVDNLDFCGFSLYKEVT